MTPDWNAIRLDSLQIDDQVRATLREMRPFFANAMPGILARFYDLVRQHEPACGIFKDGAMQEAVRMQLHHWELIAAGDFGAEYQSSATRFCELNQRAAVALEVGSRRQSRTTGAVTSVASAARTGRGASTARHGRLPRTWSMRLRSIDAQRARRLRRV